MHFSLALGTFCVLTSIASLIVVMQGATDEPYVSFRPADVLSQVGLGSALIAVWLVLGTAAYGVFTRRLAGWWLLLLPWAAIAIYYLYQCPFGYVDEIMRHVTP
jgi:hypothetical protein